MKTLLGLFTFLLLTAVTVLGQKYGQLQVQVDRNGHIVDPAQFHISLNGQEIGQTDSMGNFFPAQKIKGLIEISHPKCLPGVFEVELTGKKSYEWAVMELRPEIQDSIETIIRKHLSKPCDTTGVSDTCDVEPQFPGGLSAMRKFLAENIRYPQSALENGISGKVYTALIIDTDGSVRCQWILRGFDNDCDAEALRVISILPKFIPAQLNGKPVAVEYRLPMAFSLL